MIALVLALPSRPSFTLDPLIAEAKRRARRRRAVVALALALLAAGSAGLTLVPASRAARGDGTIIGGVLPTGTHSYVAATVTAKNSLRHVVAGAIAARGGRFRLTLPAGRYVLKAEYTGHPCLAHVVVVAHTTRHANLICKSKLAAVPHLTFRQKLVKVATTMARSLRDPSVKTALLYGPASYQIAEKASSGGGTTPNQKKGRFYVIVLHGSFRCPPAELDRPASPPPGGFGHPPDTAATPVSATNSLPQ
jgi:hypothetical protein